MKTIWKYQIPSDDYFTLSLPRGTKILSVQEQFGNAFIWCLVNPNQDIVDARMFRLAGTGHPVESNGLEFIGTFQLADGNLVFHLFEIIGR